jgi:hypothetical protein
MIFFNPVNLVNLVKFLYGEPLAKVNFFVKFSPLSLDPFPPMGAREIIVPQYYPAPTGGRMSVGQEGGFENKTRLLQVALNLI